MMRGFSLLEVLAAIAILAGLLISMARIVSHSYYYTERVRDIYMGTELARLKLHDIEEMIKKDGIPTADKEEEGDFDEKAYEGFKWRYSIKRVHIPIPDVSGSGAGDGGGQEMAADMLMGARSMIEDFIKEKIRKLTLRVWWGKGDRESEQVSFVLFIPVEGAIKEFQQLAPGQGGGAKGSPQKGLFGRDPGGAFGPARGPSPAVSPPGGGRGLMNIPVSGN